MITSMGFTEKQAQKALKATDNNVARAADWIFSHMDELNEPDEQQQPSNEPQFTDGNAEYRNKKIKVLIFHPKIMRCFQFFCMCFGQLLVIWAVTQRPVTT